MNRFKIWRLKRRASKHALRYQILYVKQQGITDPHMDRHRRIFNKTLEELISLGVPSHRIKGIQ